MPFQHSASLNMNYSILLCVFLLYGQKVLSISYPFLSNRLTLTQEELVRRRVLSLSAVNALSVNPSYTGLSISPSFPTNKLQVQIPRLPVLKKLPEVKALTLPNVLPDVKKMASFKKPEMPMLKTLPAILTIGGKKETNFTPPKIEKASSSLQDLLKSAMTNNKQPEAKSTEYNRDEVWKNFKALQDRASQYLIK